VQEKQNFIYLTKIILKHEHSIYKHVKCKSGRAKSIIATGLYLEKRIHMIFHAIEMINLIRERRESTPSVSFRGIGG